ncbi:12770_t:CDS:2, partial [Cetraspora pellucida]
ENAMLKIWFEELEKKHKTNTAKLTAKNAELKNKVTKLEQKQTQIITNNLDASFTKDILQSTACLELSVNIPTETTHVFNLKDKISISSNSSPENNQYLKLPKVEVNTSTEDTKNEDDNKESFDDNNSDNEDSFNNNKDDGGFCNLSDNEGYYYNLNTEEVHRKLDHLISAY